MTEKQILKYFEETGSIQTAISSVRTFCDIRA